MYVCAILIEAFSVLFWHPVDDRATQIDREVKIITLEYILVECTVLGETKQVLLGQ